MSLHWCASPNSSYKRFNKRIHRSIKRKTVLFKVESCPIYSDVFVQVGKAALLEILLKSQLIAWPVLVPGSLPPRLTCSKDPNMCKEGGWLSDGRLLGVAQSRVGWEGVLVHGKDHEVIQKQRYLSLRGWRSPQCSGRVRPGIAIKL